jgi:hypothetical protein
METRDTEAADSMSRVVKNLPRRQTALPPPKGSGILSTD